MTRETSRLAWEAVKEQGMLKNLHKIIYWGLCNGGPMTANELRHYLDSKGMANLTNNSGVYGTRLSELKRMNAVHESGKRKCNISGFTCLVWEITGELPSKSIKLDTKAIRKNKVLNELHKMYAAMKNDGSDRYLNWINEISKLTKEI